MFTNEDFDLDEDFLNDISQKESQYYSQALSSDDESSTKRFKKNEDSSEQSYSESTANRDKLTHAKLKKDFLIQNTNDIGGKKPVRTNLILQRLNRNENITSDPSLHERADKSDSQGSNSAESSLAPKPSLQPTNDKCRKTRILEKLKRSNVESVSTCSSSPEEKSCPRNPSIGNPNNFKLEHREPVEKSQLKPVTTCNKPVTLVRQFPGPAGLVPHPSGGIIRPLIPEAISFNSNNNDPDADTIDTSMVSKYYSQNTTNLFSEGAWQSLISDLSPDFLSGHEISTVKQKVLTDSYTNSKIPFLAGIVQRVDFSSLDPLVILKDCTGTIEGTMCKNILVEYPHVLDIGVVLFLGDIGFLTIGSYLKKCHVIITLRNIINVYTCKSRMFSISEMDARLQNFDHLSSPCKSVVNQVLNSPGSSNSKFGSGLTTGRARATQNLNAQLSFSNSENVGNLDERKHVNLEASKTSTDKGTNLLKNNDKNSNSVQRNTNSSQCTNPVNIKSTFESAGDLKDFDDDFAASFLDIDDDILFSKAATDIDSIANSESQTHAAISMNENTVASKQNLAENPKLPPKSKSFVSKTSNIYNKGTTIPEAMGTKKVTTTLAAKEKSNSTKISDIRLKLSVFKSDSELTQQPCEDLGAASTKESPKQNESNFTSSLLLNGENDSDEELFSELDVESIVSNYNRLNDVN